MDKQAIINDTIQQYRLSIDPKEAERIFQNLAPSLEGLDVAQKNAVLLIMERYVLKEQGGHRLGVSLEQSDAANNPDATAVVAAAQCGNRWGIPSDGPAHAQPG